MSTYLASRYNETLHRLALGIELFDTMRDFGLMRPARIDIERTAPHSGQKESGPYCRPQQPGKMPEIVCRHNTGRYSLLYYSRIGQDLRLRIYDHYRYYIPRRIQVPLLSEKTVESIEFSHSRLRSRRIGLFPGAAYNLVNKATGLRGRVLRNGVPMRWAVVDATMPATGTLVGRTRSDDRGEFLLLLGPLSAPQTEILRQLNIRVSVSGSVTPPAPDNPDIPGQDTYWDLPLETLPAPGLTDDVSPGAAVIPGYATALSATRTVQFQLGSILTGAQVPPFEFSL